MIVVALIALLAAIAVPNYVKNRSQIQRDSCLAHLKQIDNAKAAWARDHKKAPDAAPGLSDIFGDMAYIKNILICPAGGTYTLNRVDTLATCSHHGHVTEDWELLKGKGR